MRKSKWKSLPQLSKELKFILFETAILSCKGHDRQKHTDYSENSSRKKVKNNGNALS